jgi:sulfur transfer protein SufE
VWINAELDAAGRVRLSGTSDSDLTRGMCAVLVDCLSGLAPEEVLQVGRGHPARQT